MGPGAPGRPGTPGFPGRPEGPELPGLPCPWGPGRKRMKSLENKRQMLELQIHSVRSNSSSAIRTPTVSPKLSQHVFVFTFLLRFVSQTEKYFVNYQSDVFNGFMVRVM